MFGWLKKDSKQNNQQKPFEFGEKPKNSFGGQMPKTENSGLFDGMEINADSGDNIFG